jgi:molecular chaperone GrpE
MVNKKETETQAEHRDTSTNKNFEPVDTTEDTKVTKDTDIAKQTSDTVSELEATITRLQEEAARIKADFLNARRRLEDDRERDAVRLQITFIRSLLPLCDSFQMAMQDVAWHNADGAWKKGIEGIYAQLQTILKQYNVSTIEPAGEPFDHHLHEAVGMEPTTNPDQQDMVMSVLQSGYELTEGETKHLIRPARVTTGVLQTQQ